MTNNQKIIIRPLSQKDLGKAKQFQIFINRLIEEDAPLKANKKVSLKEEENWLKNQLAKIKAKKTILLVAESNNKIIGNCGLDIDWGRRSHVAKFCITIDKDYRSQGVGGKLAKEIIQQAKTKLKAKIIRLSVYPTNKKAIKFYQKLGFKQVSIVPKQIQEKGKLISEIIMLKEL